MSLELVSAQKVYCCVPVLGVAGGGGGGGGGGENSQIKSMEHRVKFTPSKLQLLFKDYELPPNTSTNLTQKFGILIFLN